MAEKSVPVVCDAESHQSFINLAIYGDQAFAFQIVDDRSELPAHVSELAKSAHALMRVIRIAERSGELTADEAGVLFDDARVGVEFIASMSAQISTHVAETST